MTTAMLHLVVVLSVVTFPGLASGQAGERTPLPGARLARPEPRTLDPRPAGPAPAMIYARALGPTTARVTYSQVAAATGYQLYRSGGGSGGTTLVQSITINPNLVIAYDPTAYGAPPPRMIPGGTSGVAGPPMTYQDPGRSPKATYTYAVVATYPDSAPYRAGTSEPTTVAMPPGLPPAGLTATTSLGTTVTLSWIPAFDATGYLVFRDGQPITTQPVRGTSYVDPGLAPGLYTYSVISFYRSQDAGEIQGELTPRPSVQVVLSRCRP
jgi:hypothetical protein